MSSFRDFKLSLLLLLKFKKKNCNGVDLLLKLNQANEILRRLISPVYLKNNVDTDIVKRGRVICIKPCLLNKIFTVYMEEWIEICVKRITYWKKGPGKRRQSNSIVTISRWNKISNDKSPKRSFSKKECYIRMLP